MQPTWEYHVKKSQLSNTVIPAGIQGPECYLQHSILDLQQMLIQIAFCSLALLSLIAFPVMQDRGMERRIMHHLFIMLTLFLVAKEPIKLISQEIYEEMQMAFWGLHHQWRNGLASMNALQLPYDGLKRANMLSSSKPSNASHLCPNVHFCTQRTYILNKQNSVIE